MIPFNSPYIPPASRRYLGNSLISGHLSGDGPMTRAAVSELHGITQRPDILLTPSCTSALELACRLAHLRQGDEVILPSFNFPSAASAVVLSGATPVFADVDPTTLNITARDCEWLITPKTRAIIVLHYAGNQADVLSIRRLADLHNLIMIEDAAHGLGVHTDHGILGSHGHMTTYSFHETKNIQCGEGGALQINDLSLLERSLVLREKGTNRHQFMQGMVHKYTWIDAGGSWLLADPLAAVLLGQLEEYDNIQRQRLSIVRGYRDSLTEWAQLNGVQIVGSLRGQSEAAHLFALVLPSLGERKRFADHMHSRGIATAFHYQPLHSSAAGRRFGRSGPCPVSETLGDCLIRLPVHLGLSDGQVDFIIEAATHYKH